MTVGSVNKCFLALLVLLSLLASTFALFEDQAGDHDWFQEHVGKVVSGTWLGDNVAVGSKQGALALLDGKDGSMLWRVVLSATSPVEEVVTNGQQTHVLAKTAAQWHVFEAASGAYLWSSAPAEVEDSRSDASFVEHGRAGSVVVLQNNAVSAHFGSAEYWSFAKEGLTLLKILVKKNHVLVYGVSDADKQMSVFTVDLQTGLETEPVIELRKFTTINDADLLSIPSGALLVMDKKSLAVVAPDLSATAAASGLPGDANFRLARGFTNEEFFLLETNNGTAVMQTNKYGVITLVTHLTEDKYAGGVVFPAGKTLMSVVNKGNGAVQFRETSLQTKKTSISMPANTVAVDATFTAELTFAMASEDNKKLLLVGADDSVRVISKTKQVWVREEALAAITGTMFVALPPDSFFDEPSDVVDESYPGFFERVVPEFAFMLSKLTGVFDNAPVQATSSNELKQDHFGFRKLIIALTEAGKVFAMNTETGAVVWNSAVPPAQGDVCCFSLWKVFDLGHHHALLISKTTFHDKSVVFQLHFFDPIHGVFQAPQALDYNPTQAFLTPLVDVHDTPVILLVAQDAQVHLLPKTDPATVIAAKEYINSVYFHTEDLEEGVLAGFKLLPASETTDSSVVATSVQTWTVAFPKGVETISAVANRQANEIVQDATEPIGAGKMGTWIKYLNPNLLAVSTVRTANEDSNIVPSLKRSTDPCINVYLIDSISGAILGKLVHRGGAGPVHVVQSENFVVYHFWNNDQTQYEMSVLQLYEDEDTSKGMVRGDEFSSFQTLSPRIEQQTFVLEAAVAHLAVSSTQNGVTSKEVLVGLENGQVLGISKQQVLNVRRPLGAPTAHDKADMLMPYAREIPMLPTKIRSYKHTIQNLRNIVTTHALLESQSLVLAYGLDVFFTHVTPAGGFDLLSDEFNKPMLVLTVCGVAAALYFAKMFAAKKQLKEAWA